MEETMQEAAGRQHWADHPCSNVENTPLESLDN
jgi:hypothetical protein